MSVPSSVEMAVATRPTRRLARRPCRMSSRSSSRRYHSSENPVHSTENFEALNENAISTRSGTWRKKNTAATRATSQRGWARRTSALLRDGGGRHVAHPEVEQHRDQYQRHQDERRCRAERPVASGGELILHQVADHQLLRAAQQVRREEGA